MIETVSSLNRLSPIRMDQVDQGLSSSPKKNFLLSLRQNLQTQYLGVKSGLAHQILHIEHCFYQINLAIVGIGHRCLLFGSVISCNVLYYIIIHSFSKEARKTTRQKNLLRKLRRVRSDDHSLNSLQSHHDNNSFSHHVLKQSNSLPLTL